MRQVKILFLEFIEFHFQSFEASTLRTTMTEKYRKLTVGKTGNFKFPEKQLLTQQQIVNNYCIVRFAFGNNKAKEDRQYPISSTRISQFQSEAT